jgi:hypothetical protein
MLGMAIFCMTASLSSGVLIDDFESYELGDVKNVARPPWFELNTGTGYADIAESWGNKFLTYGWESAGNQRGAYIGVPAVTNAETATLFVRIFAQKAGLNHSFGLADTTPGTADFNFYEVQCIATDNGASTEPFALKVRNGGLIETCTVLERETWYNVWMVIDQTTDKFDVYVTTGKTNATPAAKVFTGASFRNGTTSDLIYFVGLSSSRGQNFRVDDIHLMRGVFLYNPTIDVTAAHYPSPANGAANVMDGILTWNTGRDPNDLEAANPKITHHYLYLRDTDPNFLLPDTQKVLIAADGLTGSYEIDELVPDTTYYWRVDEVLNNGSPTDPQAVIEGTPWSFDSWRSAPVVTGDPVGALVSVGADALFTTAMNSYSTASVMWFRYVDGINDQVLTDANGNVLNGSKYAVSSDGKTYASLTVKNAETADEGYYYCILSSQGGSAISAQAPLGIRELKAHWTLNGLVEGMYADEKNSHPAEPNGVAVFTDGVNPAVTGQAAQFAKASGSAYVGTWNPSEFSGQLTVSLWAKWAGHYTPATFQGLIAKRNAWGAANMMWQMELDQTNGNLSYKNGSNNYAATGNLPVGQWTHIVATFDGTTAVLYRDGLRAASATVPFSNKTDANLVIGAVQRNDAGVYADGFNGLLDDVQLYSYALDKYEVADLYYGVTGQGLCLDTDKYTAAYDFDNNCRIDISDFAMLASEWLKCGRYPAETCSH